MSEQRFAIAPGKRATGQEIGDRRRISIMLLSLLECAFLIRFDTTRD
jgi:hypothetical protein